MPIFLSLSMCVFAGVRSHTKDGQEEAVFSQEAVEAIVAGAHFKLVQLNTCASCVEQWAILGEGINTESLEVEVCVYAHACMHVRACGVCVRACVRACVCVCVRAHVCVRACVNGRLYVLTSNIHKVHIRI